MVHKSVFQKKCSHMKELLSSLRTSQIVLTNSRYDNLMADAFCQKCEMWCFGIEISAYDHQTRRYDYGVDLIPIRIESEKEVTPQSAAYFDMKLSEEHKEFKEILKKCGALGCLNSVFRNRAPCQEDGRACPLCEARRMIQSSEIEL